MAWEYAIFGREAEDHGGVKMPLPTHCRSGVASVGNDGLTAWIRHQSWSDSQNMAQIICEIIKCVSKVPGHLSKPAAPTSVPGLLRHILKESVHSSEPHLEPRSLQNMAGFCQQRLSLGCVRQCTLCSVLAVGRGNAEYFSADSEGLKICLTKNPI